MSMLDSYRNKSNRLVAGIMSGTSLDGIDVAFVGISGTGRDLTWQLHHYAEIPYDGWMRSRIHAASTNRMSIREAFELDADLGAVYAAAILQAAESGGIQPGAIDAVGLHGQTVYHAPHRGPCGLSVQLGNASMVAERLRTLVVNDFRSADIAAGGQGAPLVPYCDYLLLHSPERNRVALNIGGIANITWLGRLTTPDSIIAFDTGPGNMLVDAAMHYMRGVNFDDEGQLAASGWVDERWLAGLLDDPYFRMPPPKSAGREQFGVDRAKALLEEGVKRDLDDASIVATLTALTSRSIAMAIRQFASGDEPVDDVIVGGGGARNHAMLGMLAHDMPGVNVMSSNDVGLPADAKEAICFAILANEALCETPASVPSVTGAARRVVLGAVRLGSDNY